MSLEKIKELKQMSSFDNYIGTPFGCDAENVDMSDGSNLEDTLSEINEKIADCTNSILTVDGITITRDDATKVIALAKTLQDKIALVDNKIDKTNVANNLTTTEADFVLDARQGKALQDQLTTLNGSLNSKVVFNQDGVRITKISPHAYILHIDKLISLGEGEPWKEIVLGDMPFSCADTSANIVTQDGDAIWLMIVNNKLKINTLVL